MAKVVSDDSVAADLSNSPTMIKGTAAGMILGTAAYMSPEQARGRAVDKRTDLWAFGVVLMEMLTGKRLFKGDTVSDVIAAVLTQEVDWTALPDATPQPIRRLLRRCLEKDRKSRLSDATSAKLEIDDALSGAGDDKTTANVAPPAHSWRRTLVRVVLPAVLLTGLWHMSRMSPDVMKFMCVHSRKQEHVSKSLPPVVASQCGPGMAKSSFFEVVMNSLP